MPKRSKEAAGAGNGATLGFEAKLWQAADLLRNNLDAAQYKHVVLGLIFLKYISDAFEERRAELTRLCGDPTSDYFTQSVEERHAVLEDRDEYRSYNVFWVPEAARWAKLQAAATQPEIGKFVDDAMVAIERENPSLRGVLNKEYARPDLNKQNLGRLIDLVSGIGLGHADGRSKDLLGRVYEYFLAQFASAEGKKGGQFYTPRQVVRVLVEMLEPFAGRVFDPCCGSGGMFVQSERFVEAHGGRRGAIAIYGQESNPTTWRLAKMNLAIRGIDADLGPHNDDSFTHDLHPDLRADFVLANPPFNDSNWKGELLRDDKRWIFGTPPVENANFAWVEHFISHLAPHGSAGFVLANGSLSTHQRGEGVIRRRIVEDDLVDCVVAMPNRLFYSTAIEVCLWIIARSKAGAGERDRRGNTLFIDARGLGTLVDRAHRELSDSDINQIAAAYRTWRRGGSPAYEDAPGFCRSVATAQIAKQRYVLTPGIYVQSMLKARRTEGTGALVQSLDTKLAALRSESNNADAEVAKLMGSISEDRLSELSRTGAWEEHSIYDLCDVAYGLPYSSKLFNERGNGMPLLRIRDLATHAPEVLTSEELPRESIVKAGDIVAGMDGEFRVVLWHGPPSRLNQRVCLFTPKPGIPRTFLAAAIQRHLELFERAKSGTTVVHLSKTDIDSITIPLPPAQVLASIGVGADSVYAAADLRARESTALREAMEVLIEWMLDPEADPVPVPSP